MESVELHDSLPRVYLPYRTAILVLYILELWFCGWDVCTLNFQTHLSNVIAGIVLGYADVDARISDFCALDEQCTTGQLLVR